jgi:hypothetical protein
MIRDHVEEGEVPNKTLAATQLDQMNSGEEVFWNPPSLALAVRSTIERVAFRHVEVYGSCGSPLDNAGKA